jgi:hypothetical protein
VNKEQFKELIIRQFKEKDSAISWLAPAYENTKNKPIHQGSLINMTWVEEFNLLMKIETLEPGVHQIQFVDCDKAPIGVGAFTRDGFNGVTFAKEFISVTKNDPYLVILQLKVATLIVNNYIFSFVTPSKPAPLRTWVYDIKKNQIFCANESGETAGPVTSESLDELVSLSENGRAIYEYATTNLFLMDEISLACIQSGLPFARTNRMLECFSPKPGDGLYTPFLDIINNLHHYKTLAFAES